MIDKEKSKALKELGLKEWQVFTVAGDTEYILLENVISVFSRQKAEIERLKGWQDLLKAEKHSLIKAEAVKAFAEIVKEEIVQALESNYKAQNERLQKTNKVDEFITYCDGKISALRGIDGFIDNLLKETEVMRSEI